MSIQALKGHHMGQTAWIVGKGASLVMLTKEQIGAGPVIAINDAIIAVESLDIENPLYSMQKDADEYDPVEHTPFWAPRLEESPSFIPLKRATLLVHKHESPHRMSDYRPRCVFDNIADFGLQWWDFSSLTAIAIARLFGCAKVVFVAHDASLFGDIRTCRPRPGGGFELLESDPGYLSYRAKIDACLAELSMPADWYTPTSPDYRWYAQELLRSLPQDGDGVRRPTDTGPALEPMNRGLHVEVLRLNREVTRMDREATRLTVALNLEAGERSRLGEELSRSHAEARRLSEAVNQHAAATQRIADSLKTTEAEARRLTDEVLVRNAEISRLAGDQERTRNERDALRQERDQAASRILELSGSLDAARQRIADLLSSASWRWTAPLRAAKRMLFGLDH